jgi:hypothetical protein
MQGGIKFAIRNVKCKEKLVEPIMAMAERIKEVVLEMPENAAEVKKNPPVRDDIKQRV